MYEVITFRTPAEPLKLGVDLQWYNGDLYDFRAFEEMDKYNKFC